MSNAWLGFSVGAVAFGGIAIAAVGGPLWRHGRRTSAVALSLAVLGFATLVYAHVGGLDTLQASGTGADAQPPWATAGAQVTPEQIEGMVAGLAARLKQQPDDVAGWRMLARSYENLGRFEQAVEAWQAVLQRSKPDADLLTDYAVTLGMARGQTLSGEPEAVLDRALSLNPDHVQALALSGSAAFERGDPAKAIARWEHLLSLAPDDERVRATIAAQIDKARQQLATTRSPAP